jgi:hypothetical protein
MSSSELMSSTAFVSQLALCKGFAVLNIVNSEGEHLGNRHVFHTKKGYIGMLHADDTQRRASMTATILNPRKRMKIALGLTTVFDFGDLPYVDHYHNHAWDFEAQMDVVHHSNVEQTVEFSSLEWKREHAAKFTIANEGNRLFETLDKVIKKSKPKEGETKSKDSVMRLLAAQKPQRATSPSQDGVEEVIAERKTRPKKAEKGFAKTQRQKVEEKRAQAVKDGKQRQRQNPEKLPKPVVVAPEVQVTEALKGMGLEQATKILQDLQKMTKPEAVEQASQPEIQKEKEVVQDEPVVTADKENKVIMSGASAFDSDSE